MNENVTTLPKFGRSAEVRATSFDEADNTIEVVWTTGAAVRRLDWRTGRYYSEVLEVTPDAVRLDRLNAGAPLLDTHDDYSLRSVLGSVVPGSAKIDGGKGTARVQLSNAAGDADVVSKIRGGIIRNISVGYAIHKVIKTEADGDGADDEWRVVDWEPLEISAVPVPADAGSQIRKADKAEQFPCVVVSTRSIKEASMPESVIAAGDIPAEIHSTNNQEGRSVANENIESRAAETVVEPVIVAERSVDTERAAKRAADEALGAERKRVSEIRKLAKEANEVDLGDTSIDAGHSVDQFRSLLLEALMKREAPATDNRVATRVGVEHAEKRAEAIQSVLLNRINPAKNPIPDGAREFRGMTLVDMAKDLLEAKGFSTRGMNKDEIAGEALATRAGGMLSTSDFPIILGNTINRTLRAAYEAVPQTFRPLVRETSVSDFKEVTRAQLGEAPRLERVNEHGEYKRGSLSEGSEKYRVYKYGKIIGITREAIVNDDLNAFSRLSEAFGFSAAQLESDLVWAELLSNPTMGDNVALFHASHKNLAAAAAFAETPLGKMRTAMAKQTGLDGKTVLNIRPSFVIVPMDLEISAEKLLHSAYVPTKTDDAVAAVLKSLSVISEPRLDGGLVHPVTGATVAGSSTAYYLAAAPAATDVIELAYLNGNRGVFTDSRMAFNSDGIEIKARMEVGAKVIDWRAFQKNAGA